MIRCEKFRSGLAAGAVVTAMGVAMVTGELTSFSYWLLDTFPILARLG